MTLAKLFPELAEKMHADRRDVTVEMLLAHRGGFPSRSSPEGKTLGDMHRLSGTPREQRRVYAELFLKEKPDEKPGAKYIYSNAGVAIAGVLMDRLGIAEGHLVQGAYIDLLEGGP